MWVELKRKLWINKITVKILIVLVVGVTSKPVPALYKEGTGTLCHVWWLMPAIYHHDQRNQMWPLCFWRFSSFMLCWAKTSVWQQTCHTNLMFSQTPQRLIPLSRALLSVWMDCQSCTLWFWWGSYSWGCATLQVRVHIWKSTHAHTQHEAFTWPSLIFTRNPCVFTLNLDIAGMWYPLHLTFNWALTQ